MNATAVLAGLAVLTVLSGAVAFPFVIHATRYRGWQAVERAPAAPLQVSATPVDQPNPATVLPPATRQEIYT
jgi:hypothetical protein